MEEEQVIPASKKTPKDSSGMNKALVFAIVVLLLAAVGGAAFWFGTQRKAPEPTQTSVETATPTESPSGSPTTTPKPTKTPKPTNTPTPTPTATATPVSFQITNVVAGVAPSNAIACSPSTVTFNFSATITANAAGTATYKWERSDGAGAPTESVTFDSAGSKSVNDTWTLSRTSGQTYNGWERVHVL